MNLVNLSINSMKYEMLGTEIVFRTYLRPISNMFDVTIFPFNREVFSQ